MSYPIDCPSCHVRIPAVLWKRRPVVPCPKCQVDLKLRAQDGAARALLATDTVLAIPEPNHRPRWDLWLGGGALVGGLVILAWAFCPRPQPTAPGQHPRGQAVRHGAEDRHGRSTVGAKAGP
jgi:hypothetical protein